MFKDQILVFSLIGRQTILMICCLLISCHISTRLPARSWSETEMVQTKPWRVFSEDDFSSALVEAPTNFNYNSLKTECCSGENVLAVLPTAFWRNHKGVGMFQNCLQNGNGDIYLRSTLAEPSVLFLGLSLAFFQPGVDPLGEFSWSRLTDCKLLAARS